MVAVLPDDARQALALPRRLVAGAADGEVGVAAAALAAVRSEVPEAGHAAVALLPDHARFAAALPSLEVALRKRVRLLGSTIEVYLANFKLCILDHVRTQGVLVPGWFVKPRCSRMPCSQEGPSCSPSGRVCTCRSGPP